MSQQQKFIKQAFDDVLHEYELMHPRPQTDTKNDRRWLILMLCAAILMSARHSIPFFIGGEMADDPIGILITVGFAISVVVMVEIGLVKLGEFLITYLDDELIQKMRPVLMVFAVILLLVVAVFANIIDQLEVKDIYVSDNLKLFINIIVGLTAPLMAFLTGIIFASLELKVSEDARAWQDGFNAHWEKFKDKNEVSIQVSKPRMPSTVDTSNYLSAPVSNGQNTGHGYTKNMSAQDIVRTYIEDNPDALDVSSRELPKIIFNETGQKVSKSTAGLVQKEMREALSSVDTSGD